MAAIFGKIKFFLKIGMATLQITCGSKISSKSLYLAGFSIYKHFYVLEFFEKFENSKWPPFFVRQISFENWHGYFAEIPCMSKISSKSLNLARFSRYKHFYVLQFFENWDNYSAEIPSGSKILSKLLYLARFLRYKIFQDPKKLWQSLRKVLHRTSETVLPAHSSEKNLADTFASFFTNKISKIRDTFSASGSFNDTPDYVPPAFNTFKPVTEDEVRKCINGSPTKSCLLDPIPTFLLRDCLDILLPSITKLVNYSLSDGSFPSAFKRAVVTPLIKKASLPKNDLKNYCPVSGLCFLSKLVE